MLEHIILHIEILKNKYLTYYLTLALFNGTLMNAPFLTAPLLK